MRMIIVVLLVLVGCSTKRNEPTHNTCAPVFDKAVGKLQKFAFSLDTLELDSALIYYTHATHCDTLKVEKLEFGRYRESLTIIDNVYKVRNLPPSRLPQVWMIKGWLFERLGDNDSSAYYYNVAEELTQSM